MSDEPVWTMSVARYQHLAGVHQPWIAEISPMQYAHLSKRAKAQYDVKRSAEWQASADCKDRYALEVMADYDAGLFKVAGVHPDASRVVSQTLRRRAETAKAERFATMRSENHITDLSTLSVGQRVWSVIFRQYGTVTKVNKKSCLVRFSGDRDMKCTGGLDHRSYNDLKAALDEQE